MEITTEERAIFSIGKLKLDEQMKRTKRLNQDLVRALQVDLWPNITMCLYRHVNGGDHKRQTSHMQPFTHHHSSMTDRQAFAALHCNFPTINSCRIRHYNLSRILQIWLDSDKGKCCLSVARNHQWHHALVQVSRHSPTSGVPHYLSCVCQWVFD